MERLADFVRALGATPVVVDPVTHDHVLAYTSHLPQLTASALMHVVGESVGEPGLRLSGSGLADTTRVAASPAPIWSDICATNADEVLPALDKLIATLQALRGQLGQGQSMLSRRRRADAAVAAGRAPLAIGLRWSAPARGASRLLHRPATRTFLEMRSSSQVVPFAFPDVGAVVRRLDVVPGSLYRYARDW